MRTTPDILRPGLELVFIGINPGERSARERHYYGHPGNAFWRALSASTLVEGTVGPADDRALPARWGIGFTDVVKRVVTDSQQVGDAELRRAAPGLERRIGYARPRAVCFTSTRAFAALFPGGWTPGAWGDQRRELAGARVWVMPSTSGRAAAHRAQVHRVLAELAASLGRGPTARPARARREPVATR